jgi:L-lactate dehydrogenase complex protein LldG
MSQAKANILRRLKEANPNPINSSSPQVRAEEIFSDIPESELELVFKKNLEALAGEVFIADSAVEAANKLSELLSSNSNRIIYQQSKMLDLLKGESTNLVELLNTRAVSLSPGITNSDFGAHGFGITIARALIARTGSVVIDSLSCGGRRASVLPEHHIVLASRGQLVPNLTPILVDLSNDSAPNYGCVITGPSRTSDIEKTLVLGAHGPKRLSVIIV